jgi:predicted nucleic-acid-binding protein
MSIGLDTSVVLRILVAEPADLAQCALRELRRCLAEGQEVRVSDLVVAETYYALQFHYRVPKVEALTILNAFLAKSGVQCLGTADKVLKVPNLATSNPGFVDRMIHAEYRQDGSDLLTFEKAAGRLPHTRVLTP